MNTKNFKRQVKNDNGLTLIELVAAMAILAIILVPLTMMSLRGITSYYHEQEKIELMESGQFALFKISKQIRLSDGIASTDSSSYVSASISGTEYKYEYQSSTNELIEYIGGSGTGNAIAENITGFSPSLSGDLLSIDLKLTGPKYGEIVNLKTSIYLRNQ